MIEKQKLLQLIYDEPYQIGIWCGYSKLNKIHNDWLRAFLWSDKDLTIQGHRGSYKTTCIALFLCIHLIIKPRETVMFFRKTDGDVAQVIREVYKILQTGAMQEIVRVLYGIDLVITRFNNSTIDTNLHTGTSGTSQISAMGIGASITGKHADIIVTDDIVNTKDRNSKAERERTILAYLELQNIKNKGGRFINTGTPWHEQDAFKEMPNIKKFDCYSTGILSEEEIKARRESMPPTLFAVNYELVHIADEKALFTTPNTLTHNYRDNQGRNCDQLLAEGICHIDAAYGGEDATAVTFIKRDRKDNKFYVLGKKYDGHINDYIDRILAYKQALKIGTTHCETNADKGYLAKELMSRGDYVETYSEHTNKFYKISSYVKKYWNNIWFHPDTDNEYLKEILDYHEHAEHDDCPDSLASALRVYEEEIGIKHFKEGLY